ELHNTVYEPRLLPQFHGLGFIEGRDLTHASSRAEEDNTFANVGHSIADIGAEGEIGSVHESGRDTACCVSSMQHVMPTQHGARCKGCATDSRLLQFHQHGPTARF